MPYAKADVVRAIEFWKLAIVSEHGIAIAIDRDRRWFRNILDEARRLHLQTEEAHALLVTFPEEPEDEVWIVRKYDEQAKSE
jgi:hypothetical protein